MPMPVSHWAAAADGLAADERECFLGAQIVSIVHPSEVDLDDLPKRPAPPSIYRPPTIRPASSTRKMELEMPFTDRPVVRSRASTPVKESSPTPLRSVGLSVNTRPASPSSSRTLSPCQFDCETPETPELSNGRPRSTSSISTIENVLATPDSTSDDGHGITRALQAMPIPSVTAQRLASALEECATEDEEIMDAFRSPVKGTLRAPTVRLVRSPVAGCTPARALPTTTHPVPPRSRSPSRSTIRATSIPAPAPSSIPRISHGNVTARKTTSPITPVPVVASMSGHRGHADSGLYGLPSGASSSGSLASTRSSASGSSRSSGAREFGGPAKQPLRNLVAAPARLRVSFALPPLFAISERSEKPERPRTDRADSVPVEAHGRPKPQQLPRRASSTTATPADDGTVNRWPWGARRVTPLSAEVVAAVRSRSNSP